MISKYVTLMMICLESKEICMVSWNKFIVAAI